MEQSKYLFNAACYCRLSKDDENDGTSVSIESQIQILSDFCKENNLKIFDFYCDDGVSGTTFERDGFKAMMSDIEAGKVGTVITKDLSRLGRDYLKTGEYIEIMSKGYEVEQADLKAKISELSSVIEVKEQKSADTSQFLEIVRKYTEITELTPEIMHELIEKIIVHAPDKSSGHRVQQIDIYYRFNIAVSAAIADQREYDKKRKAA